MSRKRNVIGKMLTILVMIVCCGFPAQAKVEFFDDFNSGASPLWSNDVGNWKASGGVYYAQNPGVDPITYTGLPYNLTNFIFEVDINNVVDGGIFLRSSLSTDGYLSGVSLVTRDYGGFSGIYWHIIHNLKDCRSIPILNRSNTIFFNQQSDPHLKVVVNGNKYSVFVDGNPNPATSLTTGDFPSGRVAFYNNSFQTYDNVQLIVSTVPLPGALLLFGSGLLNLAIYHSRKREN